MMILNEELQAIQDGKQGEGLQKVLNTLIMYGEAFDAKRMVKITGSMGHVVFGSAPVTWIPVFDLLDELLDYGLKSTVPYTADPLSFDPKVPMTIPQKLVSRYIYSSQNRLDQQYDKLGFAGKEGYTCTCYLPEVGNVPNKGDILSWAESSAVVYANSVIGARSNRNSGVIDHMGQILGYVPEFGLLTDEGRRADWVIEIRTEKKPEAQILGSAIGMKVVDQVPYIKGLDRWLGTELTPAVRDYLKDMGAATASNGAVGLFHAENLTPEAVEQGESLINDGAQVYVIDDAELERVKNGYPCIWKDPEAEPELCFIGCPHLSVAQMLDWTERISASLRKNGRKTVTVPTVFTAAPGVISAFREACPDKARELKRMKIVLSSMCPLGYSSNPLSGRTRMITCSNKFRYYSAAKFYPEEELLSVITGGETETKPSVELAQVKKPAASTVKEMKPRASRSRMKKGKTMVFHGRPIVKGEARAAAAVSHGGFNPLASIVTAGTPINRKGRCMDQNNPDLYKKVVTGKALCLPEIIGSTTGGMVLYSVCRNGYGPACMLFSKRADTLGVSGAALLANWSEQPLVVIDELGEEFLQCVREGMTITAKPDGTVILEG